MLPPSFLAAGEVSCFVLHAFKGSSMFEICPERPGDAAQIESLLDEVFGPGRFARTAYRLREGQAPLDALSFVALEDGGLRGSIRFAHVMVGEEKVLFLGPLVVKSEDRGRGIGFALIDKGLEAASQMGASAVLLVGDEPYYARSGFQQVPAGRIFPIGPIDPARLLAFEIEAGALAGLKGPLMPLPSARPRAEDPWPGEGPVELG